MDPHHFGKLDTDPDPHQSEKLDPIKNRSCGDSKESWRPWSLTKEPWRACRLMVAD